MTGELHGELNEEAVEWRGFGDVRVIEGCELGGFLLSREFLMGGCDVVGVSDGGPHATLERGTGVVGGRLSQLLFSGLDSSGAAQLAGCGVDPGEGEGEGESRWAGGKGRSASPACWTAPWSSSGTWSSLLSILWAGASPLCLWRSCPLALCLLYGVVLVFVENQGGLVPTLEATPSPSLGGWWSCPSPRCWASASTLRM